MQQQTDSGKASEMKINRVPITADWKSERKVENGILYDGWIEITLTEDEFAKINPLRVNPVPIEIGDRLSGDFYFRVNDIGVPGPNLLLLRFTGQPPGPLDGLGAR